MKKIKGKRVTALALVTTMTAALLTGCGGGGGGSKAVIAEFDKNLVYKATYYDAPGDLEYINTVFSGEDGKLYTQGVSKKDYKEVIVQVNPDTGEAEKTFADSNNAMENSWASGVSIDAEGNFWKIIGTYVANEKHPELGKNVFSIRKESPTGEELAKIELKTDDENFWPNKLVLDKAGNVYLAGSNSVLVFDSQGKEVGNFPITTYVENIVKDEKDTVYLTYSNDDYTERIIGKIDMAAKQLVEVRRMSTATSMSLFSTPDGIYLNDMIHLYKYNMETDEKTKVLNWINSDINGSNTYGVCGLADGRIACSVYDDLTQKNQLMIAEKVPAEEVKDKKLVSLAMPYNDYVVNVAVVAFNKQNEEYRVVVDDYSKYATTENYNAGAEKMNEDMIAGKVPDLISVGSLHTDKYISKGLFADLYEKMDADSEFNRADYMENILKAFERDGKLYSIAPSFSLETVIAKESNVGKTPGWTMEDLEKLLASKPEGTKSFNGETRSSILSRGFFLGIDQYINYAESTCNFGGEEFIKLLNFAKQFPDESGMDGVVRDGAAMMPAPAVPETEEDANPFASDKVLLQRCYLYDYNEIHDQKYYNYGGSDLTFIGFPTANKQGSAINTNMEIAMYSKAAYPDGAWAFIKFLLSDTYQASKSYEWPIKKSVYPALKEKAQKPDTYTDENGKEQVYENTAWIDGKEVKIGKVTDEEIKKVDELLNSVTQVMRYDDKIWEIINEESGAFFSDQKPAEEVAKLIQNRVQTYLSETN